MLAEKNKIPPAKKSIPIRKAILTAFAPRFVSLRKVSFTLKARYNTMAEKKTNSNMSVNVIAIMVKSIDICFTSLVFPILSLC